MVWMKGGERACCTAHALLAYHIDGFCITAAARRIRFAPALSPIKCTSFMLYGGW